MDFVTFVENAMLISGIVLVVVLVAEGGILLISKVREKNISYMVSRIMNAICAVSFACFIAMYLGNKLIDYLQIKGENAKNEIMNITMEIAEKKYEEIEEVKTKVYSSGYVAYVDGIEVDIDNINLEYYSITIDDEQKKIFMTTK